MIGWPRQTLPTIHREVEMELIVDRCAGLDVGKDEVVACVRTPSPSGRGRTSELRTFPTFTSGLEELADWLSANGVVEVVMEATGQYWKPIWYLLEDRRFDLKLVNARHVKMVPGHKTDLADAAWLAELLEHGLLKSSFVPPAEIRELRDLTRYRKRLIQTHTAEQQRVQKVLEDAGIKLDSVASDVLGVSGRLMLRALIAGERDPEVLADLAKATLRNKIPMLREALRGRFGDHHATMLRVIIDHVEYLETAIAVLDTEVDRVMVPFSQARDRLDTITGVGKRAAECIIAEIGIDMGRFPTAAHLASWAGMCPANNITGGKRRSGKTNKGNKWLGEILNQSAFAASHTRDSYLAAQFWRLNRRIGAKKAAVAVGHSILVICWHLLSNDCDYHDLGGDYFVRRTDNDKRRDHHISQLHDLGYSVTLTKVA